MELLQSLSPIDDRFRGKGYAALRGAGTRVAGASGSYCPAFRRTSPDRFGNPTGDDEHAARMESADAAVGRRQEQIDRAVTVRIADANRIEAERVAGDAAGEGAQQAAVLTR